MPSLLIGNKGKGKGRPNPNGGRGGRGRPNPSHGRGDGFDGEDCDEEDKPMGRAFRRGRR